MSQLPNHDRSILGATNRFLGPSRRGSLLVRPWLAQVDATPKDGRTETVSNEHLPETLAWLARLLEVGSVATEEPGMPDGRKDGSEPPK
jgi:hypothetical protein